MLKTSHIMTDSIDEYLTEMEDADLNYLYCSAEQLLSEDIWKKFEFDPITEQDDLFLMLDANVPDIFLNNSADLCEIRNHDCMWAGHCGSKEHPSDELKTPKVQPPVAATTPGIQKTPVVNKQHITSGRSVLLKPIKSQVPVVPVPIPVLPSPESPPISDDEDPTQTSTLKMLNDAINECDLEEDSDLCEYFEEGEDIVSERDDESPQPQPQYIVESDHSYHDHSYHKDKNSSMRISSLGIDTPSDSEEEIDVVSIGEKQNLPNNRTFALPTNPSNRDKQQLQRKVASAITNKQITNGIKTISPIKKCITNVNTNRNIPKKRVPEITRGIKRTKQHYYRANLNSPYKKRATHNTMNSSDSEPELEKRSLHNNMERQRRIDLRNSFEDLRQLIPEVSSRERAAKVVILREAAFYCEQLGDASESMQKKVQELRRRQEYLRARVSQLRKNLAASR